MSPARRAARAGRNLLLAVLVGGLIIAAIVVAYIAGRGASGPSAQPTSPESTNSTSAVAPSSDAADAAPTGCLGGQERNNAMLLAAQDAAQHTPYGAVELASSFMRWAYRYPYPSARQANEVSDRIVSQEAAAGFKNIAQSFASANDITGGQVQAGTRFHLSTATGSWMVRSGSTPDRVTVDINAPYVIDGELSATKSAAISATLVWSVGKWQMLSQQAPDTSALSAGGTQFTAGC